MYSNVHYISLNVSTMNLQLLITDRLQTITDDEGDLMKASVDLKRKPAIYF